LFLCYTLPISIFRISQWVSCSHWRSIIFLTRSSGKNWSLVLLWYGTDRTENDVSNSYIVAYVFVAAVTFFTYPLPSNSRGIHMQTHWWEVFMKYAVKTGSYVMIYNKFHKTGSGIQKLTGGDTQTRREHGDRISLLLFFLNKEIRLKMIIV
jgi:hypothetical protein